MLTGIGKARGATTAITMGNGEPDWSYIPSAGKCSKTRDQLVDEIKELACKSAKSENSKEKEQINRQVLKLRAEYLSDVAPDRRSLYHQAENALRGKKGNNDRQQTTMGELSLLYFLECVDNKQGLSNKSFALAGGATLTCPVMTGGGYGAVIEKCGVKVLSATGAGWGYEMTPAELQKKDEFYAIYQKALRNAQNGAIEELRELPDYLVDKSSFDSFA